MNASISTVLRDALHISAIESVFDPGDELPIFLAQFRNIHGPASKLRSPGGLVYLTHRSPKAQISNAPVRSATN